MHATELEHRLRRADRQGQQEVVRKLESEIVDAWYEVGFQLEEVGEYGGIHGPPEPQLEEQCEEARKHAVLRREATDEREHVRRELM